MARRPMEQKWNKMLAFFKHKNMSSLVLECRDPPKARCLGWYAKRPALWPPWAQTLNDKTDFSVLNSLMVAFCCSHY